MTKDTCNKFIEGINPAIDNDTSRRITALRFLLIVLVVFIHNCYTLQSIQNITDSGGTAPIFVENAFGTWIKLFITSGIARSAVPIFFMFSAYLQAKKNDTYLVLYKEEMQISITAIYFMDVHLWILLCWAKTYYSENSTSISK